MCERNQMPIHFWKMFQVARPHVHHTEGENDFIQWRKLAANTSNVRKTKTIFQKQAKQFLKLSEISKQFRKMAKTRKQTEQNIKQ